MPINLMQSIVLQKRRRQIMLIFIKQQPEIYKKLNLQILTLMQGQDGLQNLYQIPSCTICLSQLTQDLSNLSCGHVFHLNCISQHFQYKGTCPNCQKRSHSKQIRMVVYPVVKNTQSSALMRQVLGNLTSQQKQQIQILFKQFQAVTQKHQKVQSQLNESQRQVKKVTAQLNQIKKQTLGFKSQIQQSRKQLRQLRKVIEHLHNQLKTLNNQNLDLRVVIQNYKEKQSEYEKVKKIKRFMNENSQGLIQYKKDLENKSTSHQDMSRLFFDIALGKNLQIFKLKNRIEQYPEKLSQKDNQISQLTQKLERQRKDSKDSNQKRIIQRQRHEQLKIKYKNLVQKYKTKCQELLSQDQNYQDSLLSRPSFPLSNGTALSKPKANNNFNQNRNSIGQKNENISLNLSFHENRGEKRSSSNIFNSMIIEEQSSSNTPKNTQLQKRASQITLGNFLEKKSSFGTFGGVIPKKRVQQKKIGLKNLFG